MQLSRNQKFLAPYIYIYIYIFFFFISTIFIKFWILSKKSWPSQVIFFWNYRLEKAELLKCPKKLVSEHLWAVNMLNTPKHCLSLHGSIFIIFFNHSERKSAPKPLFWACLKCWDCLLTYWHPMTSILSQ